MVSSKFFCYMLRSLNPKYPNSTYIGFTVNPYRRIRQHNREILGGARRTGYKGKWEMLIIIKNFPTKISALKFEWAWQHPTVSTLVKNFVPKTKRYGIKSTIQTAITMVSLEPWSQFPLEICLLNSDYKSYFSNLSPNVPLLLKNIDDFKDVQSNQEVLECFICLKPIKFIHQKTDCTTCQSCFHDFCLANNSIEDQNSIPDEISCPVCDSLLKFLSLETDIISKMKFVSFLLLAIVAIVVADIDHGYIKYSDLAGKPYEVTYNKRSLLINGKPSLFISGSVHPPRFTVDMWDGILKGMKEDGLNMVEVYLFWNLNEPEQGQFIWEDVTDYTKFIELAGKNDLFVNLRLGPYVCAEWTYGGLPAWLNTIDGMVLRDYNDPFMKAMESYLGRVIEKVRDQFADRGGPIILSQIENELPEKNRQYVDWCGELADSLKVNVPFVMCQGAVANNTINAYNGNDGYNFLKDHGASGKIQVSQPAIWTENEGWFQQWGEKTECYDYRFCGQASRKTTELVNSIVRWFSRGGDVMNYYMYQGGNNFGVTAGDGITTMYAEYVNYHADGHPNEPKHTHCNNLHKVIADNAEAIIYDETQLDKEKKLKWWDGKDFVDGDQQMIFEYRGNGKFVGIIENQADIGILTKYNDTEYYLGAYSSIVINSKYEVLYNTSNVPEVKSKRISKKLQGEFEWSYYGEKLNEEGQVIKDKTLHEQVATTLDKSEYMYYEATVEMDKTECELVLGSYKQNAFIIYVNDEYFTDSYEIGQHDAHGTKDYKYTLKVKEAGKVKLTILSEHFGIINFFGPQEPVGLHGLHSVSLCGKELNEVEWFQRPFLSGEVKKVYSEEGSKSVEWKKDVENAPKMSWFQTRFDAKKVNDDQQYALNVSGLNRGHAFINGHDLGRYWTIIGKDQDFPTQELYYIPKAWMKEKDNLLTIGEIIGVKDIKLVSLSITEMTGGSDNPDDDDDSGSSTIFWVILGSGIGVFVILVGIVGVYLYIQKKNKNRDMALDIAQSDTGNDYQKI